MKKKILFIISNLQTGGVSKSMTSLMNVIDRQRYDVSLMIVSPTGIFVDLLPKDLRIITNPIWADVTGGFRGTLNLCKKGKLFLAAGTILRFFLSLFSKSRAGILMAKLMPPIDEDFDAIFDYNGQQQCYYMVDKLKAKKKVTFFHSDYSKWPYYYEADRKYYPQVDAIFTISPHCVEVLKEWFPDQAKKIQLMENITSFTLIHKLSEAQFENPWRMGAIKLVSIGHVSDSKGSHWAIETVKILKGQGIDVHWVFVGAVSDIARYKKMVEHWDLQNNVTFVGSVSNPYPYIRHADIVVHPSQFEGKSIALDEAKLLCKPIVVTNFSTVLDQFQDTVNASICEMSPISIANAIKKLIENKDLCNKYISYLQKHIVDNSSEIGKIYTLVG